MDGPLFLQFLAWKSKYFTDPEVEFFVDERRMQQITDNREPIHTSVSASARECFQSWLHRLVRHRLAFQYGFGEATILRPRSISCLRCPRNVSSWNAWLTNAAASKL